MVDALKILVPLTIAAGAILAMLHWSGRRPPTASALIHGAFAAGVLFCMFSLLLSGSLPGIGIASLALFVIAAVAGVLLFVMHASKKQLPRVVIVTHAALAVLGAGFLLMAMRAG